VPLGMLIVSAALADVVKKRTNAKRNVEKRFRRVMAGLPW